MIQADECIYIQGVACCKVCKRPLKAIYENIGFIENPYIQLEGFEECTHEL